VHAQSSTQRPLLGCPGLSTVPGRSRDPDRPHASERTTPVGQPRAPQGRPAPAFQPQRTASLHPLEIGNDETTTDIVAGMEAGARSHLKIITAASLARITLEEILRALTGGTYPWAACCATTTRPARASYEFSDSTGRCRQDDREQRADRPRRGTARLPHRGIGDRTPGGRTVAEGQKGLAWCPSPMPRSTRFGVSRSVTPSTGSRSTSLVGDRRVLAWSSWMRTCTTLWPWVLPSTRAWRDGSRRGSSWARAGRPGARPALRTAAWRRSSTWNASSRCSSTGYAPHPRSRLRSTSTKQARRAAQLTIIPIRDHGIGKHTK
jgi:hypothetical protein